MRATRKKRGHPVDPEAWGRCAVLWQAIIGPAVARLPHLDPQIGQGGQLTAALAAHGPVIERRIAFIAQDPGALDFIRTRRLDLDNLLHAPHGRSWAGRLDARAEQWALDGGAIASVVDIREYMTPAERMIAAYDELHGQGRTMIGGIGG